MPVEIILPESDGDEAPGCTTRSIVFASIAVVMLSAVVISAALLVFTHGKQDENHGKASSARGVAATPLMLALVCCRWSVT